MTRDVAITIVLALVAALLYAVSNVLEQHEAEGISTEYAMRVGLLRRLATRPLWVLGVVADAVGYIVSAVALGLGAVLFVEPLLSVGLLMTLLLSALLHHKHLGHRSWEAAFLLCAGLALFLYEVSPTGGVDTVEPGSMVVWGPVIVGAIAVCVLVARHASKPVRAGLLGAAASIVFAASAVFTKSFVHYLGDGVFAWVPHWEPYALAVCALFGFVVMQSAFQVGNLAAAVAGIEATQVVAAVILGAALLDEEVATGSPHELFAVVVAVAAIVVGIVALARAEAAVLAQAPAPGPGSVFPAPT